MNAVPFEIFIMLLGMAGLFTYYGLTRASFAAALLGLFMFAYIGMTIGSEGLQLMDGSTMAITDANRIIWVLSNSMIIGSVGTIMFAVIASIYNHVQA